MSDLWFNVRFGTTHLQLTNKWKFIVSKNPRHIGNPKRFAVYCLFGIHLN